MFKLSCPFKFSVLDEYGTVLSGCTMSCLLLCWFVCVVASVLVFRTNVVGVLVCLMSFVLPLPIYIYICYIMCVFG